MAVAVESSFFETAHKLSMEDNGRVNIFLARFLSNPAHPSLSSERLQQTKNDNLWSARVSKDMRAIFYKDGDDHVLLYVDHHDDAYGWAAKRSIGPHSVTGALQIIELPTVAAAVESPAPQKPRDLYRKHADGYLLSLGVPELWLPAIRQIETEDDLFEVLPKLPPDVAERLCTLAIGKLVAPPDPVSSLAEAMTREDQLQNLFVVRSHDDLRPLLEAPMAKWIAFLHPTQRKLAYGSFNGAVKITGSAGTGKTVVALHRAKHLAGQGKRVLVTSYVTTLCHNLWRNLQLFCSDAELKKITVLHVHALAQDLLKETGEKWTPLKDEELQSRLGPIAGKRDCPLDDEALFAEWRDVIQAQGVTDWEGYRGASRVGRGCPLSVKDRKAVWEIVEPFHQSLARKRETSFAGLCRRAMELIKARHIRSRFDAVIVDEVQDLGLVELQFLAALAGEGPDRPDRPGQVDRLMLVGDGGQRIYTAKQSLKSVGIDVRGRSHILRLNYRTTGQIRRFADHMLGDEADDLEGGKQSRRETVSLLSGPEPILKGFDSRAAQCDFVLDQMQQLFRIGRTPDEIGIFARQASLLDMMETRIKRAGLPFCRLSKEDFPEEPAITLGTMYRAKGLEFKFVFVIDASDDQLPYAKALDKKSDAPSREDFIEMERQLFYVSLTRARDVVFVTWAGTPSRFLELPR